MLLLVSSVLNAAERGTAQPLFGHVVGSGGSISANRDEVRLEAAGLGVRGEIIPPQAEIQSQPGSDLPIVLDVSAPIPAMVVGSGNIGSGEAAHSSDIVTPPTVDGMGVNEQIANPVQVAVLVGNVSVLSVKAEVSTALRWLRDVALQIVDLECRS